MTGPSPNLAELPKPFGRYQILRPLGTGGMGCVFLAKDTILDRHVALKIPRLNEGKNRTLLKRFYREAKIAASIQHPTLCQVHDVGKIDGVHFLSMAYIDGKSLLEIQQSMHRISTTNACKLVRKLALALHHAHKQGVTHRDLKPSNIMIDAESRPIIVDFGLARPDEFEDDRMTVDGQLIGTTPYMSPEQVKGVVGSVGPSSDIFSLGIIFYELLAGQLPFQGSIGEILGRIVHTEPAPLTEFGVDVQLSSICHQALSKDTARRFHTMKEFAAAIADYQRSPGEAVEHSVAEAELKPSPKPMSTGQLPVAEPLAQPVSPVQPAGAPVIRPAEQRVSPRGYRKAAQRDQRNVVLLSWGLNAGLLAMVGLGFYLSRDHIRALIRPAAVEEAPSVVKSGEQPSVGPTRPAAVAPARREDEARQELTSQRLWNGVLSSMPNAIDLSQPGRISLPIGQIPQGPIPWDLSIDAGIANLGDAQSLAVAKSATAAKWSIQLLSGSDGTTTPVAELELENRELVVQPTQLVTQGIAKQLRFCSLTISSDETKRHIHLGAETPPSPLILDLTQSESRVTALDAVPDLDMLQVEVEMIRIDVNAWEYTAKQSELWQTGAEHCNEVLDEAKNRLTKELQSEQPRRLTIGTAEAYTLSGPVPIRLGVTWDAKDEGIVLSGYAEYKDDSNWRRITPDRVGPKFETILRNYRENNSEFESAQRRQAIIAKQAYAAQAELLTIPQNTVNVTRIARRNALQMGLTRAQGAINSLDKTIGRLGKLLPQQREKLRENAYVLILAMALDEHTQIHYRLLGPHTDDRDNVITASVRSSQPAFFESLN